MFATLFSAALLAASFIRGVAADFTVDTPADVETCSPMKMTWDATKGPYNVVLVSASDPCGDILADLGDHDVNHITWNATLPAGSYMISVEDGNGDEGWSSDFAIKAGSDASCIAGSSSTSAIGSAVGSTVGSQGSTLVVTPTSTASSSSTSVAAVGAAGSDPLSGKLNGASVVSINLPVVLGAFVAVFLTL